MCFLFVGFILFGIQQFFSSLGVWLVGRGRLEFGFFWEGFFFLSQGFCYRQEVVDVSGQYVLSRCLRDVVWSSFGRGRFLSFVYYFSGCCLLVVEGNYRVAFLRTGLRMCFSQGWWFGWGSRASGVVSCLLRCELLGFSVGFSFVVFRRLG